ncbi:efflux transporter outer membrane subunit [Ampullimonas aquatilis]|uniref:efflux transporter outer membrane subunit n=1 Tax=Ampullimonas aquatilis TaxID=1341549 RepID=UPI003C714BBC
MFYPLLHNTIRPYFAGTSRPSHVSWHLAALCLIALPLTGCGLIRLGPDYQAPATKTLASQWHADSSRLAHQADSAQLNDWWQQFNDPALLQLLKASQEQSPTLADATAKIVQARGEATVAGMANLPSLDVNLSSTRSAVSFLGPMFLSTNNRAALQSSWEIDLFGSLARQREAADASLTATTAHWHDARVSLAAETAQTYVQYRHCERLVQLIAEEARSRAETARLTALAGEAGFQSPANVALAQAGANEAASNLLHQELQCTVQVKAIAALTAIDENDLRTLLGPAKANLPAPRQLTVSKVPADTLAQRPDLLAAERELASASANIGYNEAQRLPILTLSGYIAPIRLTTGGQTFGARTWSIGPNLTLPIFDGGQREANVEVAKAQYLTAEKTYRQKVRDAVREVEEALVRLQSLAAREQLSKDTARDYGRSLQATQASQQAGMASLLDLEEARRLSLNAQMSALTVQQDQVLSWIALYRAMGGGWQANAANELPNGDQAALAD